LRRAQSDGRRPAEAKTWPRGGTLKRNLGIALGNFFFGMFFAMLSWALWSGLYVAGVTSMVAFRLRSSGGAGSIIPGVMMEVFPSMVISVAMLVTLVIWVLSVVMRLQARVTVDIIRQAHLSSESFRLEGHLYDAVVKDGLLDIALKLRRLDRESARIRRKVGDSDDPLFVIREQQFRAQKKLFWDTLDALKKTGALPTSFPEIKKWTDLLKPGF